MTVPMREALLADEPRTKGELEWQIQDLRKDFTEFRDTFAGLRRELREDFKEIINAREEIHSERLKGLDARLGHLERNEYDKRNARLMGIGAVLAAVIGSIVLAYMSSKGH